jgi:membrane-bound serine protease (ClpP class)
MTEPSPSRRRFVAFAVLAAGVVALAANLFLPATAGAAPGAPCRPEVDVVQVNGRLDRVLTQFVRSQIRTADDTCTLAVVLQVNANEGTGNESGVRDLISTIKGSPVPVDIWIGPTGNQATGSAADMVAAASGDGVIGIAPPNASIEITPALLRARGVEVTDLGSTDVGDRVNAKRALQLGLVDNNAASIGDFIIGLPGVQTKVIGKGDHRHRVPVTPAVFHKLPILGQLMHTVSSPSVAYLLFVIGLALLIFELFTAGVGLAGMVGAGSLVLGSYGLFSLPVRPIGLALLLLAMFGYAVDVQTGVPRVWSGIATVSFILGSFALYDGVSISWITLVIGIGGISLAMLSGMPTMIRSRFGTPTIGREWMVGAVGQARTAVDPDGVVTVQDAPWRARTNRATPIQKDDAIRVVAIEGLVLEVEPESGGAVDYRERAKQRT